VARRLKTSRLIAQVLHNRGLDEPDDIARFLDPKLTDLHPPELLGGVDAAAERLCRAVRDRQKVCIYGDYDVDGMTGVAILYRLLTSAGGDVTYYVPHRIEEGYGVNAEAIEKIAADGARLLVTVDCGVAAIEPLARAAALGLEAIVTDHHEPGERLPQALAVVHPALPGGEYPNPELSGAGVAFKLAWQVARRLCGSDRVDEATRQFLLEATSLAALGIIADVVPLLGENRILAAYGLRGLAAVEHRGIRALISSAGLDGSKLDSYDVGFRLAPRLNAAGRMGHARLAVELLARPEQARCVEIADYLERQNAPRRRVERAIFRRAAERVEAGDVPAPSDRVIVLASEQWHAGVIGIVASRLVERFARPAVLIALDGPAGQGSGRSIEGFHLRDALAACAEHLTGFGGHAMAGGLRLAADKVGDFAAALAEYAAEHLPPELLTPALSIDAEAGLEELDYRVVEQLERLAPFGRGNPRPLVAVRGVEVLSPPQRMGRDGNTVSFIAAQSVTGPASPGAGRIRCVGFGMGSLADELAGVRAIDLAGEPVLNRFNRRTSVELHLRDVAVP
jgi:single-stranded-DNA-specific exonuclease